MKIWQLFLTINRGNAFWRKFNIATIIVITIFAIIAVSLSFSVYTGFQHFLNDPTLTPDLKPIVVGFTLQSLFLLLFSLSIASSILISPYLFLKSHDAAMLLTLPIKISTIFHARFLQQLGFSIWTCIIFGIPAILAINFYYHLPVYMYFIAFLLFIIMVILGTIISNIIMLIFFPLIQKIAPKLLYPFQFIIIILLGYLITYTISPKTLFTAIEANSQSDTANILSGLTHRFQYWPSGWYVQISFHSLFNSNAFASSLLLLIGIFILFLYIQYLLSRITYREILQKIQEGNQKILSSSKWLLRSHYSNTKTIIDWMQIRRTRADFSQLILFFFIFFIYIGMLFQAPAITETIDPVWTPRLIIFIALTIGYFITLMALRFSFPFSSIERQKSWYGLTLPLNRYCAISSHILAIFAPTLIIIESVILLSGEALKLNNAFIVPMLILAPFIILATVTISIAIGTFFPVNIKSNPETITTTPSGLFALICCFAYISIVIILLWPEAKSASLDNIIGISMGQFFYSIILFSSFITAILWKLSKARFRRFYL